MLLFVESCYHCIVLFSFCCFVLALLIVIDEAELSTLNSCREGSKMRAATSTERERPATAERTGAPSDTRRPENNAVSRQQDMVDKEV